jgi:30S ribosomal protein 3
VYARGNSSPLTEYFVWPRKDAWEELKMALEARAWIGDLDKVRRYV